MKRKGGGNLVLKCVILGVYYNKSSRNQKERERIPLATSLDFLAI